MTINVISLCSGYEGFGLALTAAGIDHRIAYVADVDPAASRLLSLRHPDAPNLGDVTCADWHALTADMIVAGYPCQPFSAAGKRKGTNDVRHIWPHIATAIRVVRPRFVLLENVAGHRSLGFGRVLADLASLGYVGSWRSVRASDVGAPHRRERVFILAWQAGDSPERMATPGIGDHWRGADPVLRTPLLKTPTAQLAVNGGSQHPDKRKAGGHGPTLADEIEHLIPTPAARLGRAAGISTEAARKRQDERIGPNLDDWAALLPTPTAVRSGRQQSPSAGAAVRPSLDMVSVLLPTPRASDGDKGGPNQHGSSGDLMLPAAVQPERWAQFAPAIARWEIVTGRCAPEPIEPGRGRSVRLAPAFVEWIMGLPQGWVCDPVIWDGYREYLEKRQAGFTIATARNAQLRLLGNGIVPLQAAQAIVQLTAVNSHHGAAVRAPNELELVG